MRHSRLKETDALLPDKMDKIEELFYGVLTTIYVAWDPVKDPLMPTGPGGDHHYLSASVLEKLLAYCRKQMKAPVTLFRSLEQLLRRSDLIKPGLLGISPSGKKLSQDIKETKDTLDGRIAGLINMLSNLSTSLTTTISSLDRNGEKYEVLFGRTSDHRDNVADKISRLKSLQNKLERRFAMIAKRGAISIISPGNEDTN